MLKYQSVRIGNDTVEIPFLPIGRDQSISIQPSRVTLESIVKFEFGDSRVDAYFIDLYDSV